MSTIFNLFGEDITRKIEKVITYQAFDRNTTDEERQTAWRERLKAEISEYCVTDRLEANFEDLLGKMQDAMDGGGNHEVGVWVSGFYGSGKSSFTKYLGFALDDEITIDGTIFREHLKNRLNKASTKALLDTVAKKFPATVVMLDLASEMLAGASQAEISTVLYLKVLQWAGYSENRKLAALEIRLEDEGRYDEFVKAAEEELAGMSWQMAHNDPLVMDEVVPALAHRFFPQFYKSPDSFTTDEQEVTQFENRRVAEMLSIVRRKSDREHVIFIIDEVGQYVASRPGLILNMDGLAKNTKEIGDGKAWLISTAQQTLTEDDPRAQLNAPELYKLNDRFPITIDLVADDIKEICYRRLLGKSPSGEAAVGKLFDDHGERLRNATKLTGILASKEKHSSSIDTDLDKETFVKLYPFLPYHFDILLILLGRLASRTGGLGLRSAIKVVQDILLEPPASRFADRPLGDIANSVTLFDALKTDIEKSFKPIIAGVDSVEAAYGPSSLHARIAKSIAIAQIVEKVPATVENIAALMHPTAADNTLLPQIKPVVDEILNNRDVSLAINPDNHLGFLSEALKEIEAEKGKILPIGADQSRIFNEALQEIFMPPPKATLNGTAGITTGINVMRGNNPSPISGDRERIQTHIHFAEPGQYDAARTELVNDSRDSTKQRVISLIARTFPERDELVREIHRSTKIHESHRSNPDQQVKDYVAGQQSRAESLRRELKRNIENALTDGSLVFRGQAVAVATEGSTIKDATSAFLKAAAEAVFDKHNQAPYRADLTLAEKFLKAKNLAAIPDVNDPGGLIDSGGGQTKIDTAKPALQSIRDYLELNGRPNGKDMLDHFGREPFNWSPDTTRYLVAGLLRAGEIILHVSNQELTVAGDEAVAALKTNQKFKNVGISLRDNRPSNEAMSRASTRLTTLTGTAVVPLEDEISKATVKLFDELRDKYTGLEADLKRLGLAGTDRAATLSESIINSLRTDGSGATQQLGGESSPLYENLQWAAESHKALHEGGLADIAASLLELRRDIANLPNSGITGTLRQEADAILTTTATHFEDEDFHKHVHAFAEARTELNGLVKQATVALHSQLETQREEGTAAVQASPEWAELDPTKKSELLAATDSLKLEPAAGDLAELRQLAGHQVAVADKLRALKDGAQAAAIEKIRGEAEGKTLTETITLPAKITTRKDLESVMAKFHTASHKAAAYEQIDLTVELGD